MIEPGKSQPADAYGDEGAWEEYQGDDGDDVHGCCLLCRLVSDSLHFLCRNLRSLCECLPDLDISVL